MRTSARTGLAFAVAGLATSGIMLTSTGAAQAATVPQEEGAKVCRYQVIAKSGLNVRSGPGVKYRIVGALDYGTHISADCMAKGWTQLRGGVPKKLVGKWVARMYLHEIKPHHSSDPSGGVSAGAGGTSTDVTPVLAAGLGSIALGGGAMVMARRRRATSQI
ncbi:SH3 domain-containing protein [Actinomadura viridis]|uniref:SH3 domain-containing protein n=1 Tax=Actinomadura viridis TaxID=58110 RepID=UPI0036954A3E